MKLRPLLALVLLPLAMLAGCAHRGPPKITLDTSIVAVGQSSRVKFVVLHYTKSDKARALHLLSQTEVSSHYLITDDAQVKVLRLVDENRAAWHAGISSWGGHIALNNTSIGIELVNSGWQQNADGTLHWQAFNDGQIQVLMALLQDIIARHGVLPQNIVGHSDIAPQRKVDPGPLFPWALLARAGIGRWYDEAQVQAHLARFQSDGLPDTAWFQAQLQRLGYACPQHGDLDRETIKVLAAFQMHYRPTRYNGEPDAQTAAIMLALP